MSALPSLAGPESAGGDRPLDRLARFAAGTRFADLPPALVEKAKIHILDTVGAALAGTRSAEFRMVRSLLHAVPPREDGAITGARVWGTPLLVSGRDAALANGVAAHAFELDDTGGCDHSGAVVVPAVLAALAQAPQPVSGKALIASVVVGYDVGRRVLEAAGGYDAHNGAGWHSTGTCGPIGAAAAIANLWRLSPERCCSAIALATSTSAGLWAFIHDGSQAKKIHAGRAAEGGLLAAALAAQGLSGPTRVFDEVWGGFFTSFNHRPGNPEALADGLGTVWKLDRVSLKPYASCRGTHSAVDCVEDILAESGRAADSVAAVAVRLSPMLMAMCGAAETGSLAGTQMSLPYAIAARLLFGGAGLDAYAADRRRDPRLPALLDRIRLRVDEAMRPLDEPEVELRFADGSRIARVVPRATGAPERPMTPSAIDAKFAGLAAMALPAVLVGRLGDTVAMLDRVEDCRVLEALLCDGATGADAPIFV